MHRLRGGEDVASLVNQSPGTQLLEDALHNGLDDHEVASFSSESPAEAWLLARSDVLYPSIQSQGNPMHTSLKDDRMQITSLLSDGDSTVPGTSQDITADGTPPPQIARSWSITPLRLVFESATRSGLSSLDLRRWTRIDVDPATISGLMSEYLSLVHPFHRFFDEKMLLEDLASGSKEYCSTAMVSAICSVACV